MNGGWSCQGHGPHAPTNFFAIRLPNLRCRAVPSARRSSQGRALARPIGLVLEGSEHGRTIMECGMQVRPPQAERLKGTPTFFNRLRGNDRHPKGRDAKRLGCAPAQVARPEGKGAAPKFSANDRPSKSAELHRFRPLPEVLETCSPWRVHCGS